MGRGWLHLSIRQLLLVSIWLYGVGVLGSVVRPTVKGHAECGKGVALECQHPVNCEEGVAAVAGSWHCISRVVWACECRCWELWGQRAW
jgi:hypothetical protein